MKNLIPIIPMIATAAEKSGEANNCSEYKIILNILKPYLFFLSCEFDIIFEGRIIHILCDKFHLTVIISFNHIYLFFMTVGVYV